VVKELIGEPDFIDRGVNAGRSQLYRQAAARNGVTVAAAGAAAFTEVVSTRLRPGEYYQSSAGAWVRK